MEQNESIVSALNKALCEVFEKYVNTHSHEPDLLINLSQDGYNKYREESDGVVVYEKIINRPPTLLGYPYKVNRWQVDDFFIQVRGAD